MGQTSIMPPSIPVPGIISLEQISITTKCQGFNHLQEREGLHGGHAPSRFHSRALRSCDLQLSSLALVTADTEVASRSILFLTGCLRGSATGSRGEGWESFSSMLVSNSVW